ncbi:MAG: PLDc N-terminal domain-containing protein [Verrucomicrobia bacterium]|nr:PLDc N-terminal domain-containing protein [Verrucomicrobiota bacterium]MDE3100447.1 PLDc N-terminal domain-containing protein [Verrucomicrobiota bacterium]
MLGMAVVGVNELLFGFPLVIVWIWTLIGCIKRKQFIWLIAVLLTSFLGAIAYWMFGRRLPAAPVHS